MEAVRPRSRRRRERDKPENSEAGIQDSEQLDGDKLCELKNFQLKIVQHESTLTAKRQIAAEKKTKAKADVKYFFDELHELLERKEAELISEVDNTYEESDLEMEEKLNDYRKIRDPVDIMLDKCKFRVGSISNDMLKELCAETDRKLKSVVPVGDDIPELTLDFDTKTVLNDVKYGSMNKESGQRNEIEVNDTGTTDSLSETTSTVENPVELPASDRGRPVAVSDDDVFESHSELDGNAYSEYSADYGERVEDFARVDSFRSEHSSTEDRSVDNATAIPSAPPLTLVTADDEENPPPYWEAVGLEGPAEQAQCDSPPPLNTASYDDPSPVYTEFDTNPLGVCTANTMEVWHSFPLRRQYDMRKPLYVALTWDDKRICVVDRNNKMIKFFSPSGSSLTEMYISSGEVYDVAYLESQFEEARYIATLPKERLLLLLAVMENNSTKLVKKIHMTRYNGTYYTSICRGPKPQTLVGAVTTPGSVAYCPVEKPHVEMFDFNGKVLQVYHMTSDYVEFQYPRSVQVVGDSIFVADWKLSLVAVFLSDGTRVGQYKGTSTSPLMNPLDLGIDSYGNCLIVDGEFSNIHVISPKGEPIEVMKVPKTEINRSQPKLVAFDKQSHRLAVVSSNGDLAVFSFRNNYQVVRPGEVVLPQSSVSVPANESLPFVEGMLPTTIASIGRQRTRNNQPQFFL